MKRMIKNTQMNAEEFYIKRGYPILDKFDRKAQKFDYYDMLDFAEKYHESKLNLLPEVRNILYEFGRYLQKGNEDNREIEWLADCFLKEKAALMNDEEIYSAACEYARNVQNPNINTIIALRQAFNNGAKFIINNYDRNYKN